MDSLVVLVVLALLAILIGSILGFVSFGRTNELRRELALLRARLAAVEAGASLAAPGPDAVEEGIAEEPQAVATPPASEPVEAEPVAADAPEPQPAAAPEPAAPAGRRDLEEAIGTRWAVWVGGLALALGGVFLVRYSIEAGLIGPAARIGLGLVFAALLIGVGEWLRRTALAEPSTTAPASAYVPGVLTAAGVVAAFAAVYAAHALYGLIGSGAAFVALAAVGFGALALALLHGPAIAGLGLVASYATPLLVSSSQPQFGALTVYLLAVTAATFAVARMRRWRGLAVAAALGTVPWSVLMIGSSSPVGTDGAVTALHVAASLAMTLYVFVVSIHPCDPGRVDPLDRVAVAVLSAFVVPVVLQVAQHDGDDVSFALMTASAAAFVVAAYSWPAVRGLAGAAVAIVLAGYFSFGIAYLVPMATGADDGTALFTAADLLSADVNRRMVVAGVTSGLLFAGLGLFGVLGSAARTALAVAGAAIPLGLVVVFYLRTADFAVSYAVGVVALVVAGWFAIVTEALVRRLDPREHGVDGAIAVYAVATVAALGTTAALVLERGFLTIALALLVPAIAWVETARPVRGLRIAAAAAAAVVAGRFVWDPAVVGADLGTTPVFNWLLYGYGVPALAFGFAAWRFGRNRMDRLVPLFEALAVIFTALTTVMIIHHAMNGGRLVAAVSGVAEAGLMVATMLAVSLGMQWIGVRRPGPVFSTGTLLVGAVGLAAAAIGLGVLHDPLVTGEPIDGGATDADLFLGYLLPAGLALAVAALANLRPDRPVWFVRLAAWLGGLCAALWVTIAVRAAWHVGDLRLDPIEEGELYAYSAVWLAAGLVVLGLGVVARARAVRMVAAAIVTAVVAKVFLVDTAGLTGGLRALSFIGLGAVLVVVGLAYQKLLRRRA